MSPTLAVGVFIIAVATMTFAFPDLGKTMSLHNIATIPMAWRIHRETGPVSGHKNCSVISLGGQVIVSLFKEPKAKKAVWSLRIGYDNPPGSLRYLRINKKIFTTDKQEFRGTEADEMIELLKSPGEFALEWFQRPDYAKRHGLFGTGNFAAKAAACEDWVTGERI